MHQPPRGLRPSMPGAGGDHPVAARSHEPHPPERGVAHGVERAVPVQDVPQVEPGARDVAEGEALPGQQLLRRVERGRGVLGRADREPPRHPPAHVREPDEARRLPLHDPPVDPVALGQEARAPARPDDVDAREAGAADRRALHVGGRHGPLRGAPDRTRTASRHGRRRLEVAERALLDGHAPALAQGRVDGRVGLFGRLLHRPGPARPTHVTRARSLPIPLVFRFESTPHPLALSMRPLAPWSAPPPGDPARRGALSKKNACRLPVQTARVNETFESRNVHFDQYRRGRSRCSRVRNITRGA